jgi:hypothetical protein
MSISGGIKFFDKSRALLSDGASLVVSSGDGTEEFALAPNQNRFLRTLQSGNAIRETFDVTFDSEYTLDRLIIRNHNFRKYECFYWDGNQWRDFTGVTDIDGVPRFSIWEGNYFKDTSYYEFDSIKTTKLRIASTATQIDASPSSALILASRLMSDLKSSVGPDATLNGNAALAGGYLDLRGAAGGDYASWDGSEVDVIKGNRLAFSVKYTPDYVGSPSSTTPIAWFSSSSFGSNPRLIFFHNSSGQLDLRLRDKDGNTLISSLTYAWAQNAGQEYELLVEVDVGRGFACFYVDGERVAAQGFAPDTYDWGNDTDFISIGSDSGDGANALFRDFKFYSRPVALRDGIYPSPLGADDNAVFFASFRRDEHANWALGPLTGTLNGSAAISSGYLDLDGASSGDYASFEGECVETMVQKGAVRVKYTPGYSGTPGADRPIFTIAESFGSNSNRVSLYHRNSNGKLNFQVHPDSGTGVTGEFDWSPTDGTEYEIAVTFNFDLGTAALYIDNVLQSQILMFDKGTRTASIGVIAVGTGIAGTETPDGKFRDFDIFKSDVFAPAVCMRASFGSSVDADEAKGSKKAVTSGTVTVSGGVASMAAASAGYISWHGVNNPANRFAAHFRITPNYTTNPAGQQTFLYSGSTNTSAAPNFYLYHDAAGDLYLDIKDKDGSSITSTNLGAWAPTASTEYKFTVLVDLIAGASKVFIDNTQFGSTVTDTGDRGENIGVLRTGKGLSGDSGNADYDVDDFVITEYPEYASNDYPIVYPEKFVNQIVPTKEIGTFSGYPTIAGPMHSRNIRVKKMLSGKSKVQKSEDSLSLKVSLIDYPANNVAYSNDVDTLMQLFDQDDPFLIWLCGGRYGSDYFGYTTRGFRLRDIYQVDIVSDYDLRYLRNIYKNPISFDVNFVEVI